MWPCKADDERDVKAARKGRETGCSERLSIGILRRGTVLGISLP